MSHVSLNVIQIYHVITNNSDATTLCYCSHIYFKVNNLYIIHIYKCTCSIHEKECHPSLQILHHMTDASKHSVFRTETQLTQLLVGDQLDAQFFYIIRLFQSSTCFEQTRAHHQGVNCINTASGIVTL